MVYIKLKLKSNKLKPTKGRPKKGGKDVTNNIYYDRQLTGQTPDRWRQVNINEKDF